MQSSDENLIGCQIIFFKTYSNWLPHWTEKSQLILKPTYTFIKLVLIEQACLVVRIFNDLSLIEMQKYKITKLKCSPADEMYRSATCWNDLSVSTLYSYRVNAVVHWWLNMFRSRDLFECNWLYKNHAVLKYGRSLKTMVQYSMINH